MKILAIETSCDETGLAIVEAGGGLKNPRFRILKNLVASQIKIHRPFGGVVPNLAKREHIKNLPALLEKIVRISDFRFPISKQSPNSEFSILNSVDLIAVTVGPGLEPALWTGIGFAKQLREGLRVKSRKSKVVGVNHLEGHLYSFLLPPKTGIKYRVSGSGKIFPAIALIVSGGHTILLKVDSFAKWRRLGETRDDAAGEAFDKVARLLNLPYPGGPEIEKLASKGNPAAINFPCPMIRDKNYDFSFSGLKTSVLYYLRDNQNTNKADVAASFQQAAIDVLVAKTIRAAKEFGAKSVLLSGGVATNKALRKALRAKCLVAGVKFFVPDLKYNMDNAAMIAAAGYMAHLRNKKYKLEARGDLRI